MKGPLCVFAWITLALLESSSLHAQAAGPVSLAGGATLVGQRTNQPQIQSEYTLSADLFAEVLFSRGMLFVYVEAGTSPKAQGVSRTLIESNTDAGTALGVDGRGRLQVSEFKYALELADDDFLTVGLLDATGYLDVSRIANDENLFFLGTSFVNNPTIEFPDYALGVVFERAQRANVPRLTAVLTQSHGLADNPGLSYSELFSLGDPGPGVFTGLAAHWESEGDRVAIGAWTRTSDHRPLNPLGEGGSNFGAFGVYGRSWEHSAVSLRAGLARSSVFLASRFMSAAYLFEIRGIATGLGAARIYASDEVPSDKDTTHLEAFVRLALPGGAWLTPSVQRLRNSNFGQAEGAVGSVSWVSGARLSVKF